MAWTHFPMAAGEYCVKDSAKYFEELYTKFADIAVICGGVTFIDDLYDDAANCWGYLFTSRSPSSANPVKYLRDKIDEGLSKWWFWNDDERPFFIHGTIQDAIGQANWTMSNNVRLGTHSPYTIFDEMYKVIDWIANEVFVFKWLAFTWNDNSAAGRHGPEGVGDHEWWDWESTREGMTAKLALVCDDLPNPGDSESAICPYALMVSERWLVPQGEDPPLDGWDVDWNETAYTLMVIYDYFANIGEDTWDVRLQDSERVVLWHRPREFGGPEATVSFHSIPVKVNGYTQGGTLNSGEDLVLQEHYLDIDPDAFDHEEGSILEWDFSELDIKAQLFIPPDRIDDIDDWVVSTAYAEAACVTVSTVVYRCILGHTSTLDDKPPTGVNWETYWVEAPEPGWSRGVLPPQEGQNWGTPSPYSWGFPSRRSLMIRPSFDWI